MADDTTNLPTSESNEQLWVSLRGKGHSVEIRVTRLMRVAIDGIEMPFDDARALDRGLVTLDEIARHHSGDEAS